jgi:hypothetical protein
MLSVARRWALCRAAALTALLTAVPLASALAVSAGVDTPSFSQSLPLAVGGTPIVTLSTNSDGSNPVVTVTGNLDIPSSLNNGIHVANGANSLIIFDDGNGHIEGTAGAWMWINGNSNAITSISAGGGTTILNQNGGNVGVNTSSPGTTLEVNGATTIDRNWLYLAGAGDTNHAIGNLLNVNGNDAEQFRYWAFLDFLSAQTGSTAMRILNNGNVGIGITSPVTTLDVAGAAHFSGLTPPVITSQGAYISWNDLTYGTGETDLINNPGLGVGGFAFMLANSAGTTVNTAMFINGSGNVGVNTTNPQATLDVNGSVHSSLPIQLATNYTNGTPCSIEGQIAYSTTDVAAVSCDGTKWNLLTSLPVANNNITCTPGLPLIWNGSKWVCPVNVTNGGGGINCAATAGGPKNWSCGTGGNNDGSSGAAGICEQYGYVGVVANGFSRQGGNCGGCYYVYPTTAVPYGNPGNGCNSCEYYTSVTCY